MPEEGYNIICDKCNIWYHPFCEGLDDKEIPARGISYYCKKCFYSKRKKKIESVSKLPIQTTTKKNVFLVVVLCYKFNYSSPDFDRNVHHDVCVE